MLTTARATAPRRANSVSIVVPFFNEATNLPVLIEQLRAVIDRLEAAVEVVLVDDGSTDRSAAAARAAIGDDLRFRVVRLRANFGKSAAIAAGRDHSAGDIVVTLDADLQDPPEEIPRFVEQIERGSDLVAGWRRDRHAPWHRRLYSSLFNRCVRAVTGVAIHDMNCGLKAYRRRVLDAMQLSRGMHRFTVILAHGNGFRVSELPVANCARLSGVTKFGVGRYFEAALGLVGALYVRNPARSPLTSFGTAGAVLIAAALIAGAMRALWSPTTTPSLAFVAVLLVTFVLGAVLFVGGLVGELLLHRMTVSARALPPYELHDQRGERS